MGLDIADQIAGILSALVALGTAIFAGLAIVRRRRQDNSDKCNGRPKSVQSSQHRSRHSEEDARPDGPALNKDFDRAPEGRPWMAPPIGRMIIRKDLCSEIMRVLLEPGVEDVSTVAGLSGAGGFGKTTLATWACHQPAIVDAFPGGLLWTVLGQDAKGPALAERISNLILALTGKQLPFSDPHSAGAELGRVIEGRGPVLLVVDDVWEESQLRPFLISGRACKRLITTRASEVVPFGGAQVLVDAMSPSEALELAGDDVPALPEETGASLAKATGHWPVLLNLVNRTLRRRVERGQPPHIAATEIASLLARSGPTALDAARPSDRTHAIKSTMEASIGLLDEIDRKRYLELAVFAEDQAIPLAVLNLLWLDRPAEQICHDFLQLGLIADYTYGPPPLGLSLRRPGAAAPLRPCDARRPPRSNPAC